MKSYYVYGYGKAWIIIKGSKIDVLIVLILYKIMSDTRAGAFPVITISIFIVMKQ